MPKSLSSCTRNNHKGTNTRNKHAQANHEALQGETSCTKLSCCSLPDTQLGPEDTVMNEPDRVQGLMGLICHWGRQIINKGRYGGQVEGAVRGYNRGSKDWVGGSGSRLISEGAESISQITSGCHWEDPCPSFILQLHCWKHSFILTTFSHSDYGL